MSIAVNLENIKRNIELSCKEAGRSSGDVKIIAVTKKRTAQEINEAISLGICDIGENRVQELLEKYEKVTKGVRWHLIGTLQTNKVKYIADKVYMIHSVDSIKLAKEIEKHGETVLFFLAEEDGSSFLKESDFDYIVLGTLWNQPKQEIEILAHELIAHKIETVLFDSYQFDAESFSLLRSEFWKENKEVRFCIYNNSRSSWREWSIARIF